MHAAEEQTIKHYNDYLVKFSRGSNMLQSAQMLSIRIRNIKVPFTDFYLKEQFTQKVMFVDQNNIMDKGL